MRLVSLRIARFPVPFRLTFRHASASRAKADNVIVVAESERGHRGYGEGCPRDYVTGETVASATTFFIRHHASIMAEVIDLDTLERWIAAHEAEIDADPAAFCAIELAILDLLGQDSGQPVERLLGLAPLDGTFRYSAILGDNNTAVFGAQLLRYWMAGFRDFKLKLSGDVARDRRKIALFRGHSDPSLRLRLDANNLWQSVDDCTAFIAGLAYPFFAVEEPLTANRIDDLRKVARALGTHIVLDESLSRAGQLAGLGTDAATWILNLRVSKLGGLLRSLAIARQARRLGIRTIVGAHVGETSVLTRAALTLATGLHDGLTAQEGAFGTHLLAEDLCKPSVMFGRRGLLLPAELLDPLAGGFGLRVDASRLEPIP